MRIKEVHIHSFKRFHNLIIRDLPVAARLVVLAGPNGSGKTSLFDGFRNWQGAMGLGISGDREYAQKKGLPELDWNQYVQITFHEQVPTTDNEKRKIFYFRTAYRNEPDFTVQSLQRMGGISSRINRFIDNDTTVADNYQRLVAASVEGIYSGTHDSKSVKELKDEFIGKLRVSMSRVFDGLNLTGVGDPLQDGAFFFEKGASKNFHYKNLSGGEKAAFDLLLDIIVKRSVYNNTIYCIDEPEMHMHTKLQTRLLEELISIIPPDCQLWIASHSIGMMRKAKDLQSANPSEVVFLDFQDIDFDKPVALLPTQVDRQFWVKTLGVALDDLANLVAPQRVVLCEGRPVSETDTTKAELDAACYRIIFGSEFPDTDFVSVGNASDVKTDRLFIGKTIQTLISGTTVVRVVDRDDRSSQEIADLQREGVRVLSKRHLEAYLMDDQILSRLCVRASQPDKEVLVLAAKAQAIADSVGRGNAPDDIKSASGQIYVETKKILQLSQCGNTVNAFLRDTLAPLVVQDTNIYVQLKHDIFGE